MWVNKILFQQVLDDNRRQQKYIEDLQHDRGAFENTARITLTQKAKDDISIDWMRHRINALEKERAILLSRVANIQLPIPEIVPTRPGTISQQPDFAHMPSFEDVGEQEAVRLGITHDDDGNLKYTS